ncbi:hypothetical protein CAPTEDRAFT_135567 [Capitella teleta]|uniref:Uncharacterized protein n=1 Tax=Capitella teleta TaxID=283909 RepID=R7T8Q3_CAPTE|nr:hypothetical protein CAPTEDRAFT_135567 [Capitella teleta]|eukprot:ELT87775.1 hypothetical protein CAPTEDRAFT_135567 [Capitella teleta]
MNNSCSRKLIIEFCERFQKRVTQYSLRGQIIAYYHSMMNLLEDFPEVRDKYFMLGEPQERKSANDSLAGLKQDPNAVHERPRRVISEDGVHVLNIHFVPHFSEILIMYKRQDDEQCCASLKYHLRIIAALHDIVQYLCAHARLGSSVSRLGSKSFNMVSADWGGTEGIGAELHEIQRQIDHLDRKTSPETIARFLGLRRDVMFLEFDAAVRHSMRDTFLATNNKRACDAITGCMHFSLHELSNAQIPAYNAVYLNVPEPLEARDAKAWMLCPWRAFINKNGPFPLCIHQCQQIEFQMQLCLAALNDVDRHVANGEILGVSLLMEDVLLNGKEDQALYLACDADEEVSVKSSSRSRSEMPKMEKQGKGSKAVLMPILFFCFSRTMEPMEAYSLMKSFLLLWKRVEVLKNNWGKSKLIVQSIDTPKLYKSFCIEYRKEVLFPILQSVARRLDQMELYEGLISDDEVMVVPQGASEVEIKLRQLIKLLENLECSMINEVRKKISRELNLVLSERSREESALPTDLWKKPVMKESFTINKPHIAEDFIANLMTKATKNGENEEEESMIAFPAAHINSCLSQLAGDIMRREKHNYESYSMYYENILRVHHQLLYHREQVYIYYIISSIANSYSDNLQEIKTLNSALLMEVTALRAKISEMREMSLTQERDLRERVKEEYDGLVQNLFSTCFDIKKKFDEFKEDMHNDIVDEVEESKNEAKRLMRQAKYRTGATAEEEKSREVSHQNAVRDLHLQNHSLNVLLLKMKAMSHWKYNHHAGVHSRTVADLRHDSERSQKELTRFRILHNKEMMLLTDQLSALRSALKLSEKECDDVKRDLEKELKAKKEKAHAMQQRAQSQKQVEEARRANIDKLLGELDDKEGMLRVLSSEQEKSSRMNQLTTNKTKKEMDSIRKQLSHERLLKLDAFQRVDELQTQVRYHLRIPCRFN